MDIRHLTDLYAVSPQIAPTDVAAIAAAGFRTLICNRPDAENPEELHAKHLRDAAQDAGVQFVENPFSGNDLTFDGIDAQRAAIEASEGPVLAYCRSGTRSTVIWMFATAGTTPVEELVQAAESAGYEMAGLAPQLEAFAKSQE